MSQIMSRAGFLALRGSWALLAASILAGAGIVAGSHWWLEREKRESGNYERRLAEARSRLDAAQRERDSLHESAGVFRGLVERGLLDAERRLDLVERVNALRARHQLIALDYEIAPQRALELAGGRAFAAVDVLASRVKLRMRALHEGDVLGFMQELAASERGFYPVDRCHMRRVEVASPDILQPRIEAECALEWITLRPKRGSRG